MKTCNTCTHSDNAHNDGSGNLEECYVCVSEYENPKSRCRKWNDSGLIPCPFCGSGAWIIEAPSLVRDDEIVFNAKCVDEECEAQIAGCAMRRTARYLWNKRASLGDVS